MTSGISAADADTGTGSPVDAAAAGSYAAQRAWQLLESVHDPEIPVVTLRELGILRAVREDALGLEVVITPTYSGCPAMEQIEADIRAALAAPVQAGELPPVRVRSQLAPAWTTDWMTHEAREKLRAWGIAPPQASSASGVDAAPTLAPSGSQVLRFVARLPAREAVPCPRCGSANTTETSHFGSTACKALWRCLNCAEPFDYFKPY